MSPYSSHIPRVLIKDVWNAWLIGSKCWRWTARSVLRQRERDRQGKRGRETYKYRGKKGMVDEYTVKAVKT